MRKRHLILLMAGALGSSVQAAVTVSFQDVGLLSYDGNAPGTASHSISVQRGATVSFDIWMNANEAEHVVGFSFLVRNYGYSLTDTAWFSISQNLNRDINPGDPNDVLTSPLASPNALTTPPDHILPSAPQRLAGPFGDNGYAHPTLGWLGTDLGATTSGFPEDYATGEFFIGRATLFVDSEMPLGTYDIGPNSMIYGWSGYVAPLYDELLDVPLGDSSFTPYSITVVPEPSEYAMAGGLVLLGFALWRRRTTVRS